MVLRTGGPNHSKPSVFIVFWHLDRTNPSYARVHYASGLRRVHSATRLGLPPDNAYLLSDFVNLYFLALIDAVHS